MGFPDRFFHSCADHGEELDAGLDLQARYPNAADCPESRGIPVPYIQLSACIRCPHWGAAR